MLRADAAATFIRQSLQNASLTLSGSPLALSLNLKYCQIGAFSFHFDTKSSAIVLSVNSPYSCHVIVKPDFCDSAADVQSRPFSLYL